MRAATLSKTSPTDHSPADGHGPEDLLSSTARLPTLSWVGGYLIVVLAIWALVGRYRGITHDAALYMLQAVARLTPDPLAQDIFLRFESQDRFTIFSSGCARVIALLGPDRAAALLTFVFLLGWYAVAWALARRLQNGRLALASVSLLLFIPGSYGAFGVFQFAERFMTPRSLAEALVLAGILAALNARRVLAIAVLILALLVHPLMAFPGALLIAAYLSPLQRGRQWALATAAVIAGAVAGSWMLGLPEPVMHGSWLEATRLRSNFLFTDQWRPADWGVQIQVVSTLLLGIAALAPGQSRRILIAALSVAVAGLTLAVLSSQVIEIKVLLQGQPWRWLWPGRFFAMALLPFVLLTLWRDGPVGRTGAMLLAGAWVLHGIESFGDVPPIGVNGLLCLAAIVVWVSRATLAGQSPLAVAGLGIGVVVMVGVIFLSFVLLSAGNDFSFGYDPLWVQRVHDVIGVPGIAAAVAATAWAGLIARQNRFALIVLTTASACLLAGAWPENIRRWTAESYNDVQRSKFADWRSLIPTEAEVLWANSATGVWLLLDRRSYLSISQGSGLVFSESTTNELLRRAQVLAPMVDPGRWFLEPKSMQEEVKDLTPEIMRSICVDPALGFVVSKEHVPGSVAQAQWPGRGDYIYLYDCASFAAERST